MGGFWPLNLLHIILRCKAQFQDNSIARTQSILSPKHFHAKQPYAHCDDINSRNTHGVEISGTRNGTLLIHYCSPCVLSMINHCHYPETTEKCRNLQPKPHLSQMSVIINTISLSGHRTKRRRCHRLPDRDRCLACQGLCDIQEPLTVYAIREIKEVLNTYIRVHIIYIGKTSSHIYTV